jgi:hypothetical protein
MTSVPPEQIPNPFNDVSNDTLYWMQVALTYSCLRSKADERKPHHAQVCALQKILSQQADARGSKKPQFPNPPPA